MPMKHTSRRRKAAPNENTHHAASGILANLLEDAHESINHSIEQKEDGSFRRGNSSQPLGVDQLLDMLSEEVKL